MGGIEGGDIIVGGGAIELTAEGINGVVATGGGAKALLLFGKGLFGTGGATVEEDEGVKGRTFPANGETLLATGAFKGCCEISGV